MRVVQSIPVVALAALVSGHGYVYKINADNTLFPGWDVRVDPTISPAPTRIAYGGGDIGPINDPASPDMACSHGHSPAPGAIAEVRAGGNITFYWSHWLHSHKGPITAWMAPYSGNVANVNVSELEFVKFAEDAVDSNGIWGTDKMMNFTNHTWTATVPADIKPGNYIIRQEIIALHFALATTRGFEGFGVSPQFYFTCFNFNVTGSGTATPKGAKFPGAYNISEPGFHYNLSSSQPFPLVGPPVYKSSYNVQLEPKPLVTISPTGNGTEADEAYYTKQQASLDWQVYINSLIDSRGG